MPYPDLLDSLDLTEKHYYNKHLQCPGCGSYGERYKCEYCGTILILSDIRTEPIQTKPVQVDTDNTVILHSRTNEGDEVSVTYYPDTNQKIVYINGVLQRCEDGVIGAPMSENLTVNDHAQYRQYWKQVYAETGQVPKETKTKKWYEGIYPFS